MTLSSVGSAAQGRLGDVLVNRMELQPPPIRLYLGTLVLMVLGVLGTGGGLFLAVMEGQPAALVAAVPGLALLIPGVIHLVRRAALRGALTVHEQGLVLSRKGMDELIPYGQMRDVALKEEQKLQNGTSVGMLRTLRFTSEEGPRQVSQFARTDEEDTFAPVLSLLLRKLSDAADARLKAGTPLQGKGWVLDSHGLHVGDGGPVRLGDLAGVGMFENRVSFWRAGEELPFFTVHEASPNARLLGVLAQRQLSDRERPMAGPLGRILFQRQTGPVAQVVLWILSGLFALGGLGGAIGSAFAQYWVGIPIALGLGGGMAVVLVAANLSRFRVHELGVTHRSLFGSRTLRYSDVTSFQFGATRHYYNGAYTGTSLSMRFTPGPGLKAIHHSQTVRGGDSDLDALREQMSNIVASQLFERWKRGEDIRWGPTARFTKSGLVVQATKLFGKGEERLAPYDGGLRYTIEQGSLHLFIGNETKAAMTVECAADNFFPGLKILGELCANAEDSEDVEDSRAAG